MWPHYQCQKVIQGDTELFLKTQLKVHEGLGESRAKIEWDWGELWVSRPQLICGTQS